MNSNQVGFTGIDHLLNLIAADVPDFPLGDTVSLVGYNELKIALENLCVNLYEVDAPLASKTRAELVTMCRVFGVDEERYWRVFVDSD
jgi:hypothetical protein